MNKRGLSGKAGFVIAVVLAIIIALFVLYNGFIAGFFGYFGKIFLAIGIFVMIYFILVGKAENKWKWFWFLFLSLLLFVVGTDFFGVPFGEFGTFVIAITYFVMSLLLFSKKGFARKVMGVLCLVFTLFTLLMYLGPLGGFGSYLLTLPFVGWFTTGSSFWRVIISIVILAYLMFSGWHDDH